jgi:hypothetical protein
VTESLATVKLEFLMSKLWVFGDRGGGGECRVG